MPSSNSPDPRSVDAIFEPGALAETSVKQRLNSWQQGDLLRGIGLFWAGTAEADPITGLTVPPSAGHNWPVVPWDGTPSDPPEMGDSVPDWSPSWAVITSQTCDVVADGPGQRHPTVQVAPLRQIDHLGKGVIGEVRRHERVEMVHVPGVPDAGTWVADLRISVPVSKGVLLNQNRIPGFADPAEAVQFAERVAAKYRRPALHDAITAGLVPRLQELVKSARGTGQLWPDHVEQFRLLVTAGDRLRPTHVALIVMLLEELAGQDTEILRNWRLAERRRLLKASGTITLGPLRFRPLNKPMDVREYRASDPLRTPDLHQPVFP